MNECKQQALNEAVKTVVSMYESGRLTSDSAGQVEWRPLDDLAAAYRAYELDEVRALRNDGKAMSKVNMTMITITVGDKQIQTSHILHEARAIHGHGIITREYPSIEATKEKCRGCRDDYYNHGGNSTSGECWALSSAKVVDKVGHTSIYVEGGPDGKMTKTLSCWHSVQK